MGRNNFIDVYIFVFGLLKLFINIVKKNNTFCTTSIFFFNIKTILLSNLTEILGALN